MLPRKPKHRKRLRSPLVQFCTFCVACYCVLIFIAGDSDETLGTNSVMSINGRSGEVSMRITTSKFYTVHVTSRNNKFANVTMTSRSADRPLRDNAIVFLVQKSHSTYENRDSYGMLLKTLDLLYKNYLSVDDGINMKNTDIVLFHTGDYSDEDLDVIEPRILQNQQQHNGIVKLVNLKDTPYWNLQPNLRNDDPQDWLDYHLFPIGYRHMCRFFAIKIWDFFDTLNEQHNTNYRYIWRLDEDSYIHSPINYNVFDFMANHRYVYGYRLCSYELSQNKFVPHWFEKWHTKIKPNRPIDWKLCGFYNNFFVADLQFMKSKRVQSLLHNEIDKRGFIYRKRYGDLVVHSMLVYAFAPPERIHRFLDFTYEHKTIDKRVNKDGCIIWGAIQEGYMDLDSSTTFQHYQDQYLSGNTECVANQTQLSYQDLSPTYSHLSDELKKSICLRTISAGKVETAGKGILSG